MISIMIYVLNIDRLHVLWNWTQYRLGHLLFKYGISSQPTGVMVPWTCVCNCRQFHWFVISTSVFNHKHQSPLTVYIFGEFPRPFSEKFRFHIYQVSCGDPRHPCSSTRVWRSGVPIYLHVLYFQSRTILIICDI